MNISRSSSSGMALVVVLGLISLLLISSITFAIMMRIERASSANARNTIMARQAAKSTLAIAIAAIDQDIGTNKWPQWDASDSAHSPSWLTTPDRQAPAWKYLTNPTLPLHRPGTINDRRAVYFWKDTFGSVDHAIKDDQFGRRAIARIMGGQLQDYLPFAIRHRAYAQSYAPGGGNIFPQSATNAISPEWVPMTAGTNAVNLNNIVGRCAYLALNTSGYLDVPALCHAGDGDKAKRRYGASAAEIKPVAAFFKKNFSGGGDKFKNANKGLNFESVAEILRTKDNTFSNFVTGENRENESVFADGAAFSAFNFAPVGRMPANDDFPARFDRLCIAGDGSSTHLENLRKHKAAIITAFKLAGLTKSSSEFAHDAITDPACPGCSVCHGGTAIYTLAKKDIPEQALWAYLGLIDYIDGDSVPEGDDDYEQFARPATENTPLLNGFMATLKIFREETCFPTNSPGDPNNNIPPGQTVYVFDGKHALYGVEFNGKVVFANRNAAMLDSDTLNDILATPIEAKLGFRLEGDTWGGNLWDALVNAAKNSQFKFEDDNATTDNSSGDGGIIFKSADGWVFGDGPACFFPQGKMALTNRVELGQTIADPKDNDAKEVAFGNDFPELIYVGAAGLAKDGNKVIHRVPAQELYYDEPDVSVWLASCYCGEEEGVSFKEDKCYATKTGRKVYSNANTALSASQQNINNPDYELQRRVVNIVMWAEMIDPAFSCGSAAESFDVNAEYTPRSAIASHNDSSGGGGSSWLYCATAHPRGEISGFDNFEPENSREPSARDFFDSLNDMLEKNENGNNKFEDFVKEFRNDPEFFNDYFVFDAQNEGADGERYPGYSLFQKYLLTTSDALPGIRDGIRCRENGSTHIDGFFEQFNSLHVRNDGLDSVGELGFIPIGPYATIRLFGFGAETNASFNCGLDDVSDKIAIFNAIPFRDGSRLYDRPFHRVLDFFSATNAPTRGLVNINGSDTLTVASILNGAALNDFLYDDIGDGEVEILDEDYATELFAPALLSALQRRGGGRLSDIGWLYDTDSARYDDINQYFEDFDDPLLDSNLAREAIVRNSCGLFTDRGLNLSVILRGEAFTPFFGRSDVRNDLGTTLASRSAFAQIWRDTEPDADGNYPFFIQYFKIFDD